jgi:hypothetical protein
MSESESACFSEKRRGERMNERKKREEEDGERVKSGKEGGTTYITVCKCLTGRGGRVMGGESE